MRKRWRRLLVLLTALLLLVGLLGGSHLWAQWHYGEGQRALGRGAFAEAQQHFNRCLTIWPQSGAVHLLAARAARKAGAFDDTDRLLRRCRELGGDADAIDLEDQLVDAQRGRLAAVERPLVGRIRQDHPDSVLILEVLTVAYIRTYQLNAAQECLRRWLDREPDRLEAWLLRADVVQRLNNRVEALACYRRILELDPDNDDARLQMAGHLAHGNDLKEALAQFESLRNKQGDTPAVLKGLAYCRRLLNQPEEARRLLEAVLAEHPRDWRALAERGRLALQCESKAEAEKWFRRAAAVAPHETDVLYSLYQCLERLGKHEEAKDVQARLKRIDTDLARIADLSRAIARTPHDSNLRCEAGVIMLRNGLESEGVRWLESALGVDPRHAATHQALADYYARTGEAGRAAEHREKAGIRTTPFPLSKPGGSHGSEK